MVVVRDMLPQNCSEMVARQRDDSPSNLASDGSDKSFDVGIQVWGTRWQDLRLAANASKAGANLGREEWVQVHDDGFHVPEIAGVRIGEGAGHVQHPGTISMVGHADDVDLPGGNLDGVECMMPVGAIALRHFECGEVDCGEVWPMSGEEPLPIVGLGSLGRRRDAMPSQHVGDGSIGDRDSQLCQAITDGIFAPGWVVGRQLHNERFGFRIEAWATGSLRRVGSGNQLTMPALKGVDGDDEFLGLQNPSIKFVSERSKTPALIVRRPDPLANQPLEHARLFIQQIDD